MKNFFKKAKPSISANIDSQEIDSLDYFGQEGIESSAESQSVDSQVENLLNINDPYLSEEKPQLDKAPDFEDMSIGQIIDYQRRQEEQESSETEYEPPVGEPEGLVPFALRESRNLLRQDQFSRKRGIPNIEWSFLSESQKAQESTPLKEGRDFSGINFLKEQELTQQRDDLREQERFEKLLPRQFLAVPEETSQIPPYSQIPTIFGKIKVDNNVFLQQVKGVSKRVRNQIALSTPDSDDFGSPLRKARRELIQNLMIVEDSLASKGYNIVKHTADSVAEMMRNSSKALGTGLTFGLESLLDAVVIGKHIGGITEDWLVWAEDHKDEALGGAFGYDFDRMEFTGDLARYFIQDRNYPFMGLQNHIEVANQVQSIPRVIINNKQVRDALGIDYIEGGWSSLQNGLNIPDSEMNDIYRAIIFGAGFATFGGVGTVGTSLKVIGANIQRASILNKVAKATGQKIKLGRTLGNNHLYRPEFWHEREVFKTAFEKIEQGMAKNMVPKRFLQNEKIKQNAFNEKFNKFFPREGKWKLGQPHVSKPSQIMAMDEKGFYRFLDEQSSQSYAVVQELRSQFKNAGHSATRANQIAMNRSFDFHMAVSGMAGFTVGSYMDGYDENTGERETQWSTIMGLAGSLAFPKVSQNFMGVGAGWLHSAMNSKIGDNILGAVGNSVAAVTPVRDIIAYFKTNGVNPEDIEKSRWRTGALLSKGYTLREIKNLGLEAEKKGIVAMESLEKTAKEKGYNSTEYLQKMETMVRDGTLVRGDHGELIVNKWSVMDKRKHIHAGEVDFLKEFYKNIEGLDDTPGSYKGSDKSAIAQNLSWKDKIKLDISRSFEMIDKLEKEFPAELGGAEFLLNHILHLNVLQSLKEASSHSITASALKGKWISKKSRLIDMNRWERTEKLLVHRLHQAMESTKSHPNSNETFDNLMELILSKIDKRKQDTENQILAARSILEGESAVFGLPSKVDEDIKKMMGSVDIDNEGYLGGLNPKAFGEKNKILFFGERNDQGIREGGLIENNRKASKKAYDDLKRKADDSNIYIDITDFLKNITDNTSATGSDLPDIFHQRALPVALAKSFTEKVVRQSLNKFVPGDNIKQKLIFINDNIYNRINQKASNEFADFLSQKNTDELESLMDQGVIKGMFEDIANSDIGKSAAISLTDFIQLRSGFKNKAANVLDSSSTNVKYVNLKSAIDSLNQSLKETGLSTELNKADALYRETIRPFWDNGSPFHKIFKSKRDEYANISGENLLKIVIDHDNQEQAAVLLKNIMRNSDENTRKEIAENFYYTLARGLRYPSGNSNHITEGKMLDFLNNFGFVFKNTEYADDISSLRIYSAHHSDTLLANSLKETETSHKVMSEIVANAEERVQKDKIPDIAILKDMINFGQGRTLDNVLDNILGKTEEIGAPTTSLLEKGYIGETEYIKQLQNIASKNNKSVDEVLEQFGSWEEVLDTLRKIDPEYNFESTKPLTNVDFLKYYFRRFHTEEEFNAVMKSLKDITTHRIVSSTFPISRKNTGEFVARDELLTDTGLKLFDRVGKFFEKQYPKRMHKELLRKAIKVKQQIDNGVDRRDINKDDLSVYELLEKNKVSLDGFTQQTTFQLDREMDPIALYTILTNKKEELGKIYGKEHMEILEQIFSYSARMKSSEASGGTNVIGMQGDYTMNNAQARAFAVVRGVLSPRYAIGEFSLVQFRMQRFQMTRELLNDPTYAQVYKDIFIDGNLDNMQSLKYFATRTIGINLAVQARLENYGEKYGIGSIFGDSDKGESRNEYLNQFNQLDFEKGKIDDTFFSLAAIKLREKLKSEQALNKDIDYLRANYPPSSDPRELEFQGARDLLSEQRRSDVGKYFDYTDPLSAIHMDQDPLNPIPSYSPSVRKYALPK